MRICSLLPGATEVVAALGLADQLVAISHECDYPPGIGTKPVVVQSAVDTERTHSPDIDRQVRSMLRAGDNLYRLDESLLRRVHPTLIITQSLCEVCAVTPSEVERALEGLEPRPKVLSLTASGLEEVFRDIESIGAAVGREDRARAWVRELHERLETVRSRVARERPRQVACLEWLDPIYSAGHWMPELVQLAGGRDLLGEAGQQSRQIPWEHVVESAPEVMVLMPCGFDIPRTLSEAHLVASRPGWKDVPAVRSGEVYAVDGPAYFNRAGPRLVDGAELLAELFHPQRFGGRLPDGVHRL